MNSRRSLAIAEERGRTAPRLHVGHWLVRRAGILASSGRRDEAVAVLRQGDQEGASKAAWHHAIARRPLRGPPPFEELITPER